MKQFIVILSIVLASRCMIARALDQDASQVILTARMQQLEDFVVTADRKDTFSPPDYVQKLNGQKLANGATITYDIGEKTSRETFARHDRHIWQRVDLTGATLKRIRIDHTDVDTLIRSFTPEREEQLQIEEEGKSLLGLIREAKLPPESVIDLALGLRRRDMVKSCGSSRIDIRRRLPLLRR